jgi:5-methylcytosine-specific restriction enzyme MrcB-like protein
MPLHSILTTILAEYPKAKIEPFGGNPLANFLRHQAADEVQNALGDLGAGLTVEASAGAGNLEVAPWISVFDPPITTLYQFLIRVS